MADSAWVLICNAEVEADGLGVADVEITVRFRRESGDHSPAVFAGRTVGGDDVANEIGWA
jgi:hypothetical protein